MSAKARKLILVLLLVTGLALAPAASASYHGDDGGGDEGTTDDGQPDYTAKWKGIKTSLSNGNVGQAHSTYNTTFAPHANASTTARDAIESGFSTLHGAEPGSLDYVAAKQQVDKAHYALAFANVEDEVSAGDADAARAWFGLLEAKFGTALAGSSTAFANASTQVELDAALATLTTEYRDVSLMKVHKEVTETPELLEAGEQATAVKEAAEGRWYYLGIQAHVAEVLGTEAETELRSELNELIEFAKQGDLATTQEEAREALEFVENYALATLPREKADAFSTIKSHISAGNVSAAQAHYEDEFGHEAEEYAARAHERVLGGFENLTAAQDADDEAEVAVQAQIVKKGILDVATKVAFTEFEEAAAEAEAGALQEGLEYYAVVAQKFGWDQGDAPEGVRAVGKFAATNAVGDADLDVAERATAEKYLDKVREEIEEVFIHWDDDAAKAREKAIEGVAYFHPASVYATQVLGEAPVEELQQELEKLYDATTAQDRAAADEAAAEAVKLLDQIESGGAEVTELDSLVNNLVGKVEFVLEEYEGYFEAKEAGDETEANTEMGEAQAFTKGAREKTLANEAILREADSEAVDEILANLDEVATVLNGSSHDDATLAQVETLVTETVSLLERIRTANVEGTVTVVLGAPTAGAEAGTFQVTVSLEGVPSDGGAFQAAVSFDPNVVKVTNVDVLADVGAGTVEDGKVRFNAAFTEAQGGTVEVSVLTLELVDETAETVNLEVTVEDLTDSQGEALGVKSIEGTTVDVASVGAGANGAPGFGTVLVLSVLGLAGAVGAALRRRG